MQNFTIALLLDFILNNFLVINILVTLGAFVKDMYDTLINLTPISIKKIFISSFAGSVILCAVLEYIQINIGLCVLICFCTGVWSFKLFEVLLNWDKMKILLKHLIGNSKIIVGKSLVDTMEELENSDTPKQNNTESDNTE